MCDLSFLSICDLKTDFELYMTVDECLNKPTKAAEKIQLLKRINLLPSFHALVYLSLFLVLLKASRDKVGWILKVC